MLTRKSVLLYAYCTASCCLRLFTFLLLIGSVTSLMTPHVRLLVGRLFGLSICLKFQKREGNYTSMLLSDHLFSPYNR